MLCYKGGLNVWTSNIDYVLYVRMRPHSATVETVLFRETNTGSETEAELPLRDRCFRCTVPEASLDRNDKTRLMRRSNSK
jgi:hypothetical protein